jgi:hypothetical protein
MEEQYFDVRLQFIKKNYLQRESNIIIHGALTFKYFCYLKDANVKDRDYRWPEVAVKTNIREGSQLEKKKG